MKIFKKENCLIFLILILAATFRIAALNKVPNNLFGDEIDVGFHALSLFKSGKDYMGNFLPFYFQSLNEWRAPLLMYFASPFVGFLGLNEWGIRLPSVFFGLLSVFLLYRLVIELFNDKKIALIAAFVCSIIPWHIHYSRVAFESTLLLSLLLLGTILFLRKKFLLSAVSFSLSFYTYNTANVFTPLFVLGLFLLEKEKRVFFQKKSLVSLFLAIFICFPLFWSIFKGEAATRFKTISIFNDAKTINKIVFKRNTGVLVGERIFHNKINSWSKNFINNYLTSFSPQFLFLTGDPNPRHNVPGFGELFLWMMPFFLLGVNFLLKEKQISRNIVFLWLLLSPIPSSLTADGSQHATRLFLMIPPVVILVAYGINKIFISSKTYIGLIVISVFFSFFWFHEYFVHYPKEQSEFWDYGYKEIFTWLNQHEQNYSRIIINNTHDPLVLRYVFWTKKTPDWFRSNFITEKPTENILTQFDGFSLGKVYFGKINAPDKSEWLTKNLDEKTIYLAFQKDEIVGNWNWEEDPPKGIKVLKLIKKPFSNEPYIYFLTKEIK